MSAPRSPFWPAVLPGLALGGAALRWWLQGTGNVWTRAAQRMYVPDPDLGWRLESHGRPWLGLDSLAALAAAVLAALAVGLIIRWRERRRPTRRFARAALWVVAALPLAVPVWAFAGGRAPAAARAQLPTGLVSAVAGLDPAARLGLPAGTYAVVPNPGSAIVAAVSAGGESFDARFSDLSGSWRGDPGDLAQPMAATIRARAASVDTGVGMRSEHAREILQAGAFPELGFALTRLTGARPAPGGVAFSADGQLTFMGQPVAVTMSGTLRAPDPAARARLGVTQPDVLLASASFPLDLRATPLRPQAKDFDSASLIISVTLVLAKESP